MGSGIGKISEREFARLRRKPTPVIEDVVADGITLGCEEQRASCGGGD